MPVVLGIDLGTSKITALALDATTGNLLASHTLPNLAERTSAAEKARGRSEWDVRQIAETGCACLAEVAGHLGQRRRDLAGLGITGQQHGVVIVAPDLTSRTRFVNWQDRRGEDTIPGTGKTYVREAATRLGDDAPQRTGCRLSTGYLAVTLWWMSERHALPPDGAACFLMDYFGASLTGRPPVTDPTCAASSGIFNVVTGQWDPDALAALGLPPSLLPAVGTSGALLGGLAHAPAEAAGLPAGLPVFGGVGDNQASFLGSVADRDDSVLVNVGTGGQVTAYHDQFVHDPLLETRPFPGGGYLLVCAGLCGGQSYALLERFFRQVGSDLLGTSVVGPVYETMNELAAGVPPGCDGLRCEPFFAGTRHEPELRGRWTGVSVVNFTPAHLARALLAGMARAFRDGRDAIVRHLASPRRHLIGAGNGLRENAVLTRIVADEFATALRFPAHREEAAFGAALLAAVGAGVYPDLRAAGRLIHYEEANRGR